MGTIFRMMMMYFVFQYVFGKGGKPTTDPSTGKALPPHRNAWTSGQVMDMYVYFSDNDQYYDIHDKEALIWQQKGLSYDWNENNNIEKTLSFPPPAGLLNNGSLFAHVFFAKSGKSIDSTTTGDVIYGVHPLLKHTPRPKASKKKNLISGEKEVIEHQIVENPETDDIVPAVSEWVSFWKPRLSISLVDDYTAYPHNNIPPQITKAMKLDETGNYLPVLYFDEFWLMKEELILINDTVPELNLSMTYSPISMWKWQLKCQMDQSLTMQENMGGVEGEGENFKRMLVETSPYLLALTFAVSILRSIFDFLAFKNDISFWKQNRSVAGISVRTILMNCVCQFIVLLYLFDNETSYLILVSCAIGLAIEVWKVSKAMNVTIDRSGPFPKLNFKDKQEYASKTKEYDDYAMNKLQKVLYVLVVGYAIYSLMYQTHKGWYSWIINSLVGTVYTFEFVLMTPQLFINYKLKSVAHLPWRVFMYKALNTFIDDLFAFIIKMPTLHRLSCFRDDLVFIIYLYQRWIYPVDKKRINEFGQVFDEDTRKELERQDQESEQKLLQQGQQQEQQEQQEEDQLLLPKHICFTQLNYFCKLTPLWVSPLPSARQPSASTSSPLDSSSTTNGSRPLTARPLRSSTPAPKRLSAPWARPPRRMSTSP